MWLTFALLSPLLWALVHVLDAHCVERVFDRPWMGMITSGVASLVALIMLPFALPLIEWSQPDASSILMLVGAGVLIQVSQGLYFQALAYSEAGIVAAYWNMVPALLPIAAFVVLGHVLAPEHYLGIAVLIGASVCFSLLDASRETRWIGFVLMLIASIIQVVALLVMKAGYGDAPFFVGFLYVTLGIVLAGTAPLAHSRVRRAFLRNRTALQPTFLLILGIEVVNLVALFMSQRAIDLGIPSLVVAVESTIPAYTFALSILLALSTRFGDPRGGERLWWKLGLVGAMVVGILLLSDVGAALLAKEHSGLANPALHQSAANAMMGRRW